MNDPHAHYASQRYSREVSSGSGVQGFKPRRGSAWHIGRIVCEALALIAVTALLVFLFTAF